MDSVDVHVKVVDVDVEYCGDCGHIYVCVGGIGVAESWPELSFELRRFARRFEKEVIYVVKDCIGVRFLVRAAVHLFDAK